MQCGSGGGRCQPSGQIRRGWTCPERRAILPYSSVTVVTIDELDTDNWGVGGETITARRKRGA
ncbi:4-oxalocrotonate tautomerase family protein [Nitratidesulfovibrio sp. HK-II]|uniref:tautomerase n=1 Tax=Nitratidesulfovibrio sp. HK-II TaxID=2009266 RepID=UPI000ED8415F|nr:tautomerase [Nitratidesulfovibrio sp. HK-II]GBO97549.1 4-oxalocrotonate tautomerase [Nitratidesulfovibrio sp. HK-II]